MHSLALLLVVLASTRRAMLISVISGLLAASLLVNRNLRLRGAYGYARASSVVELGREQR